MVRTPFPKDGRSLRIRVQIDIAALARFAAMLPTADHPPAPLYLRAPDAKPSSGAIHAFLSARGAALMATEDVADNS